MENRVPVDDVPKYMEHISQRLDDIARNMEKAGIAEYVEMIYRPRRLLYLNFWIGVARGFGMAIGFTILAAVVIYLLRYVIALNIPLIGKFIADIVSIVQDELRL